MRLLTRYLINTHFDKTSTFDKWVLCFMEIWKDVPNYEGYYQVSNLGNVKSLSREFCIKGKYLYQKKERKLKIITVKNGYSIVNLSVNSKRKTIRIHILVAMAFLNHKPNGFNKVIDHKNNIKTDNRLCNLHIVSHRENISKSKVGFSSKYTGVSWNKKNKIWVAFIQSKSNIKYIGSFINEIDAHNAYQKELNKIHSLI